MSSGVASVSYARARSGEALRSLRISDICLVFFAISSIAFDDGSLMSQLSRIAIVAGTFTEIGKQKMKLTGYHAWLVTFAVVVFISRYWAFGYSNAVEIFTTVLFNLVCLSCVVFLLYRDKRRIRLVMGCMILAPVILYARVIVTAGVFAFLNSRGTGSISANIVGMFSAFGMFMAYGFYRENKGVGWWVLILINLCIALLSASRKAIMVIALVALLLVIPDYETRDALGKFAKVAVVAALLCFAAVLVMNVPLLYNLVGVRMEGMINGMLGLGTAVDASTATRMNLVAYGIEWFSERPILGFGGDNFRVLMGVYHPGVTSYCAHNNYIELLVSYGLVGTFAYYFLYVRMLLKGFSNRKSLTFTGLTVLCLVVGLLIMDYGMVEYYSRSAQIFIALAWSVLVGLCGDGQKEQPA